MAPFCQNDTTRERQTVSFQCNKVRGQEGGVIARTVGGRDADPHAARQSVQGCIYWAACGAGPGNEPAPPGQLLPKVISSANPKSPPAVNRVYSVRL